MQTITHLFMWRAMRQRLRDAKAVQDELLHARVLEALQRSQIQRKQGGWRRAAMATGCVLLAGSGYVAYHTVVRQQQVFVPLWPLGHERALDPVRDGITTAQVAVAVEVRLAEQLAMSARVHETIGVPVRVAPPQPLTAWVHEPDVGIWGLEFGPGLPVPVGSERRVRLRDALDSLFMRMGDVDGDGTSHPQHRGTVMVAGSAVVTGCRHRRATGDPEITVLDRGGSQGKVQFTGVVDPSTQAARIVTCDLAAGGSVEELW